MSSGNEPAFDERSDEIDVAWSWKYEDDELVSSYDGEQLASRVWDEREDGEGEGRRVQRLRGEEGRKRGQQKCPRTARISVQAMLLRIESMRQS